MGTVTRTSEKENSEVVALPFVYALLSSKETSQYEVVLRAVLSAATSFGIRNCVPEMIMCDFELAIINASRAVFPHVAISCCFFHLWQSLYRNVQERGLQTAYNDYNDRTVQKFVHMLAALAFVPIYDVVEYFSKLKAVAPDNLIDYIQYFDSTYVTGKLNLYSFILTYITLFGFKKVFFITGRPGRGKRKAVAPRYPAHIWNQYDAVASGQAKTNNVSEGWHNRFHLLIGKNHPDIYCFIKEIKKEQGDTEIAVVELSLGRKVKAAPKKKWLETQQKLRRIVLNYERYEDPLLFLGAVGDTMLSP